jgi:putative acetyltransferase
VRIREEEITDKPGVRLVNEAAFATKAEAYLVDTLREQVRPIVSLVAEEQGAIVGHILFSPVTLGDYPELKIMGLAPMAVMPEYQNRGIGSALVRAGLEACERLGFGAVVVLGHPQYYPRFGFQPATGFGIGCEYEVPEEVFMVKELHEGYLRGATGIVRFHEAFSGV